MKTDPVMGTGRIETIDTALLISEAQALNYEPTRWVGYEVIKTRNLP